MALGGLHYRTNELIGEDGNVINRLAPVQCNGIDGNVAVMGISLYHLDDSVVNTCRLGLLLLCSVVCLCVFTLCMTSRLPPCL